MKKVFIETEFIKLDQLLKFAELVDSGGTAKFLIQEGFVSLNGKPCTERGKKIVHDDKVEVLIPYEDESEERYVLKILKKE